MAQGGRRSYNSMLKDEPNALLTTNLNDALYSIFNTLNRLVCADRAEYGLEYLRHACGRKRALTDNTSSPA
jgi:hypothetical protein